MLITSTNNLHSTSPVSVWLNNWASESSLAQWTQTFEPSQGRGLKAFQCPLLLYQPPGTPLPEMLTWLFGPWPTSTLVVPSSWNALPWDTHMAGSSGHFGLSSNVVFTGAAVTICSYPVPFPPLFFLSSCTISFSSWTFYFLSGVFFFLLFLCPTRMYGLSQQVHDYLVGHLLLSRTVLA